MRVAAYLRVSSDMQVDGFSLPAQERAIRDYCASHGWEIVGWYRDEGLSARVDDIAKRPAFRQMLEDARARRFDAIITHKLDRFARNRRVAFNAFAELTDAKVGFVSIAENIDYSSPAGQLMLTMLVGMSQFYSDNLSAETKKGKAERKRQGIYNGLLPFGVMAGPDGVPVPDTRPWACHVETREVLTRHGGLVLAFELAAAGQSHREIAAALTARGYRTSGNRGQNPFTKDTVAPMLRNRFYLGDLPDGNDWIPGRHAAIIDPALFAAAEQMRQVNRTRINTASTSRQPWALSGIGRCGLCGATLRANGAGSNGERYIACSGRVQGSGCPLPGAKVSEVIDALASILDALTASESARNAARSTYRASRSADVDNQAQRLQVERRLARLRDLYMDGDVGKAEYQRRRDGLRAELAALPALVTTTDTEIDRLWGMIVDMAATFRDATPARQQEMCRAVFATVTLNADRVMEVTPRPETAPFFHWGGSDGHRSRSSGVRSGVIGTSLRPNRRPSRLTPDVLAYVRAHQTRSLRSLAAELGISHELVRTARRVTHDRPDG